MQGLSQSKVSAASLPAAPQGTGAAISLVAAIAGWFMRAPAEKDLAKSSTTLA